MLAVSNESATLDGAPSSAEFISFFRLFPPIRAAGLPNLSFRVFVSFLIGRKFVIFTWPELAVDEPDGDDGALRNDERFFEQHGVMSSSILAVARKNFVRSFSDAGADDVIRLVDDVSPLNVLLPPPPMFETLIFLRGI